MNHDLESMYMEVEIQNTHIDMMLITEENKSTEKELSVFFEHQKECFLNWILAKSVGDKSLCTAANFPTKSSSIQIKLTY